MASYIWQTRLSALKSLLRMLRFNCYAWRNPQWRDFADMGLGILARYERCSSAWQPHLEQTKLLQEECLQVAPQGMSLAICGAGRGFDLHIDSIVRRCACCVLLDADGLAGAELLRKFPSSFAVSFRQVELTSVLFEWKRKLAELSPKRGEVLPLTQLEEFLHALKVNEPYDFGPVQIIFSLNLLSQIPLYWRDQVHAAALHLCGVCADEKGMLPESLEKALIVSMAELQRAHLESLRMSAADLMVLVSDTEFIFNAKQGEFHREQALLTSLSPLTDSYRVITDKKWEWHVAPYGVEYPDYGVLHNVRGMILKRENSP